MIYQMQVYYGAMLDGQAIYSMEISLDDCETFPKKISSAVFKNQMIDMIANDGLNPNDFVIGYLTKEQYNNRFDKENEKVTYKTIKNC